MILFGAAGTICFLAKKDYEKQKEIQKENKKSGLDDPGKVYGPVNQEQDANQLNPPPGSYPTQSYGQQQQTSQSADMQRGGQQEIGFGGISPAPNMSANMTYSDNSPAYNPNWSGDQPLYTPNWSGGESQNNPSMSEKPPIT